MSSSSNTISATAYGGPANQLGSLSISGSNLMADKVREANVSHDPFATAIRERAADLQVSEIATQMTCIQVDALRS